MLTDEEKVGLPRRADADVERDGLLRRLRAADGPRLRAARHPLLREVRRPVDRLPPTGAAGGARSASARRSPTPGRSTPARCGRRTSSGSSCRGASTPTARWASASTTSRGPTPARSSSVDEYYGWMFENSVPGLPEKAAAGRPDAAGVHAPLRRLRDRQGPRRPVHVRGACRAELADVNVDTAGPGVHLDAASRPIPTSCPMGAPDAR